MGKNNIFIATSSFGSFSKIPNELLKRNNIISKKNKTGRKLDQTELIKMAKNFSGIIAGTEKYDRLVIDSLPNLQAISRLGLGMDNIDMELALERNIKIFKTNTTPAPAVAELTLGLILDVSRKVTQQHTQLTTEGIWRKKMGSLLKGKKLGIIGLGSIGKTLVELVSGFKFQVLAYDLFHDKAFQRLYNITYCDLDTVLNESDVISIHLNLTDKTTSIISEKQISLMKPEAILINTSRGEIIDENVLYDALKSNHIAGAGLDVFQEEPYLGPLRKLDNVVLTPHIGSYAQEIRIKMEIEATNNLIRGLNEI